MLELRLRPPDHAPVSRKAIFFLRLFGFVISWLVLLSLVVFLYLQNGYTEEIARELRREVKEEEGRVRILEGLIVSYGDRIEDEMAKLKESEKRSAQLQDELQQLRTASTELEALNEELSAKVKTLSESQ